MAPRSPSPVSRHELPADQVERFTISNRQACFWPEERKIARRSPEGRSRHRRVSGRATGSRGHAMPAASDAATLALTSPR